MIGRGKGCQSESNGIKDQQGSRLSYGSRDLSAGICQTGSQCFHKISDRAWIEKCAQKPGQQYMWYALPYSSMSCISRHLSVFIAIQIRSSSGSYWCNMSGGKTSQLQSVGGNNQPLSLLSCSSSRCSLASGLKVSYIFVVRLWSLLEA